MVKEADSTCRDMRIAFRTDASLQIGTGHVMRCLTLADALTAKGAQCHFICREHPGHLIDFIRNKGHVVSVLPVASMEEAGAETNGPATAGTSHAGWLGATQTEDAEACAPMLAALRPDWLIVDHYALDATWERALASHCAKLMVIDDLADRPHVADLLLDQTYGRDETDYRPQVPATCRLLCGAQYALLRPEFAALRPYSLQRRAQPALRELLITMGGVDKDNVTGAVLEALRTSPLPTDCRITVVLGATAPWHEALKTQAQAMPWPTRVLVGVSDFAQLMADSDLAIGAAGATSWERCCLGLPTIICVLAENQQKVAHVLECSNAAMIVHNDENITSTLAQYVHSLACDSGRLLAMSHAARNIVDGAGVYFILQEMRHETDESGALIRRMNAGDLERVLRWRNHPNVRCYMYTQHEIGLEEHARWFANASRDPDRHLMIFESKGVPLGFINFHRKGGGGIAEWGFYVAPDAPKGTGRALGRVALHYAFDVAGFEKLCAKALDFNERSIRFHASLGFQREGVLRQQHFDGRQYHDVICFGLLANEWRQEN